MNKDTLQKAIENLQIQDIYVRNVNAQCSDGFDPKYSNLDGCIIQSKHLVTKSETIQNDDGDLLFRVFVEVGVKWVKDESEDADMLALIESEFVAEYLLKAEIGPECLDEFALNNVSYHVWPYWRELLSAQCERMRLPRILLPMTQIAQNQDDLKSNPK